MVGNLSYALVSNIVVVLYSVILVLVLPKFFSIESYGYWQLYLFYIGYVGFMNLGWNDGIYLRYGGEDYDKVDKNVLYSQFLMLLTLQFAFSILIFSFSFFQSNEQRIQIIQFVAYATIIINTRYMFMYILQATNKIRSYALINLSDKIVSLITIAAIISFKFDEINYIIFADILGKVISLILAIYFCKEIAFKSLSSFVFAITEAKENINAGIKLMFANVAGILIVGNVRFAIERYWDVLVFGKVSFIISITNMLMIFINSVGIVLFPMLKKVDEKNHLDIYQSIRNLLMVVLISAMVLYFPITYFLSYWVPKYSDALILMSLLFPSLIFEAKTSMVINTFFKVRRQEKVMLKVNIFVLVFSLFTTLGTVFVLHNLNGAILSIVILLALKSIISEYYLSKLLRFSILRNTIIEVVMSFLFIVVAYNLKQTLSFTIFLTALFIYLIITRKDILQSTKNIMFYLKMG
jgi:O-antigen/teichoic acid export membrane protein